MFTVSQDHRILPWKGHGEPGEYRVQWHQEFLAHIAGIRGAKTSRVGHQGRDQTRQIYPQHTAGQGEENGGIKWKTQDRKSLEEKKVRNEARETSWVLTEAEMPNTCSIGHTWWCRWLGPGKRSNIPAMTMGKTHKLCYLSLNVSILSICMGQALHGDLILSAPGKSDSWYPECSFGEIGTGIHKDSVWCCLGWRDGGTGLSTWCCLSVSKCYLFSKLPFMSLPSLRSAHPFTLLNWFSEVTF